MHRTLVFLLLGLATACVAPSPGSAPALDAGTPDGGSGAPISTPENQWTWVPFSETRCGNGTPAGIGLNPAPGGSRRLLVYLAGGGACWDAFTCYVLKSSVHVEDTYSQAVLDAEVAQLASAGLTDRQDTSSPFRDAHFVYIP